MSNRLRKCFEQTVLYYVGGAVIKSLNCSLHYIQKVVKQVLIVSEKSTDVLEGGFICYWQDVVLVDFVSYSFNTTVCQILKLSHNISYKKALLFREVPDRVINVLELTWFVFNNACNSRLYVLNLPFAILHMTKIVKVISVSF